MWALIVATSFVVATLAIVLVVHAAATARSRRRAGLGLAAPDVRGRRRDAA